MERPSRKTPSCLNSLFLHRVLSWALRHSDSGVSHQDLLAHWDSEQTEIAYEQLMKNWNTQCALKFPSFFIALLGTFWPIFVELGIFVILGLSMQIIQAVLIGYFVDWIMAEDSSMTTGVLIWLAFVIAGFFGSLVFNASTTMSSVNLVQIKNIICRSILEKVPQVSYRSFNEHSCTALIMNLVGNDFEFLEAAQTLGSVWAQVLMLAVTIVLLILYMGIAGLVGIGMVFLHLIIAFILVAILTKVTLNSSKISDRRVELTVQLIEGIKLLKLYAWETQFIELIRAQRLIESKQLVKVDLIKVILRTLMSGLGVLIFFVPVLVYIRIYGEITLHVAFVGIALLFICNVIVFYMLAIGLERLASLLAACARVTEFFLLPEKQALPCSGSSLELKPALCHDEEPSSLFSNISATINQGELFAVTGSVASGKSAFLLSLLQEIPLQSGQYKPAGTFAYAGATPWIMPTTVKKNIVCGRQFDEAQYQLSLRVSNFDVDLQTMPAKDNTEIGDRGITLSGGQQARLNLARAVYANADFLLLDDPLSAVDSEVGNRILNGLLELVKDGKGVVLVTHQVSALQYADQIMVLMNGRQQFLGTFDQMSDMKSLEFMLPAASHSKQIDSDPPEVIVSLKEEAMEELSESATFRMYYDYVRQAFKSGLSLFLICLIIIASQVPIIAIYYWTALWVTADEQDDDYYVSGFCWLLAILYLLFFLRYFALYVTVTRANNELIYKALIGLARTSLELYDICPTGRILNRFTKDVAIIDVGILNSFCDTINLAIHLLGSMIAVCLVLPAALAGFCVFLVIVSVILKKFLSFSVQLRAIEIVSKTPLLTKAHSLLSGFVTARSMDLFQGLVHKAVKASQLNCNAENSLSFMYGCMSLLSEVGSCCVGLSASLYLLVKSDDISPALAGTVLVLLVNIWGIASVCVNCLTRLHGAMTSVQRLFSYSQLPTEGQLHSEEPFTATNGQIDFIDVCMKYRPHLPYALHSLSFSIPACSKVGIIGRTGAGKSSILQVLFRLKNVSSGCVLIDGQDISQVGLHQLRSQLSVIPQHPLIFKDTLARNLDPLKQATEEELFQVIEQVQLTDFVKQQPDQLNTVIDFEERSLSSGQKQLVCLARVLLRQSKVVLLDEPTSNVDQQTDTVMQAALKKAFSESTVLTIAHRLRTVIDADLILVMDEGQCKELGSPSQLASDPESLLTKYIDQTGPEEAAFLRCCLEEE